MSSIGGHVHAVITWGCFTSPGTFIVFLSFPSLPSCLLWNSWSLGHSWIPSISCLPLSPASSKAFFPLGSLPRRRHRPHRPKRLGSEICRSKNIHPLYPNNRKKKKKMLFLDQEWQAFFPPRGHFPCS